jgi:hypothetical protein
LTITREDFDWDEFFWKARVTVLRARGFQSRKGAYGARDTQQPSDGVVDLVFAPEGRGGEPLTDSELELINWFLNNDSEVFDSLVRGVVAQYRSLQDLYDYSLEEKAEYMPDVNSVDDLRSLIGLQSIYVHPLARNGVPYIGFEFGCVWDEEHGLGVLMNGTRVVEVGGADTAILLWIAEKDAAAP